MTPCSEKSTQSYAMFQILERNKFLMPITKDVNNNNNDNNEFISAYPFYMNLPLRPKIIYT